MTSVCGGSRSLEDRGEATVRELIVAFFEPLCSQIQNSPLSEKLFVKLMGRVVGDRPYEFPEEVMGQFREVASRYVPAFMRRVPVCPLMRCFGEFIFPSGFSPTR
jgi:hypothetical protein